MSTAPALLPTTPSLILQRVGQSRGDRLLFEDVDVALHPGQLLWVEGANGSGKTSLLRLICGLSAPRAGRVHVGASLLYLGHRPGLKDQLSVIEQLRSSAALAASSPASTASSRARSSARVSPSGSCASHARAAASVCSDAALTAPRSRGRAATRSPARPHGRPR